MLNLRNALIIMGLAVVVAGCEPGKLTGFWKDGEHAKSGNDDKDDERVPMQRSRDAVDPVKKPEVGVDYDPRSWIANQYHPGNVTQMMSSPGFKGMTQVTYAGSGGDFNPHLDAKGETLYYASTRYSKNPQICIQGTSSRAVQMATEDQMADMMPKISPDGRELAWCSNRYGNWDILVEEANSRPDTRPRQLTQSTDDDIHPTWSPVERLADGKTGSRLIAFSRFNSMDGIWQIWVMNYHTRTLSYVTEGLFPEFCPVIKAQDPKSGEPVYTLAYQRARRRDVPFYSVWTIEVKMGRTGAVEAVGSPLEIIANDKWAAINPAWSPDGRYLVFSSVRKSALSQWQSRIYRADDVWVVRLDGTDLTQITKHSAPDWDPWWAKDPGDPEGAGRIYFTSERNGVPNIWSVKPIIPGLMAEAVRETPSGN